MQIKIELTGTSLVVITPLQAKIYKCESFTEAYKTIIKILINDLVFDTMQMESILSKKSIRGK